MALANNTPFYKAPAEIQKMAYDLAVLPAWYAEGGESVRIDDMKQAELLHSQLGSDFLFPRVQWILEWEQGSYVPWGWDPAFLHQLRSAGIGEEFLLTDSQVQRIRFLSSRQRSSEMLVGMRKIEGTCGESVVCHSVDDVNFYMSEVGEIVLKAPWSGSGRGLVKVSSETWSSSVRGWVERVLRTQGSVMAEPLYEKVADFAMEFYADGSGGIYFIGYSLFETDLHGNYKENRLCTDEQIEAFLSSFIPVDTLRQIKSSLAVRLSALLQNDYSGCLGVDMMICRMNDAFHVHPCVEINLRMNMGIVSHQVRARLLHPRSEGWFRIEYFSADGEAVNAHRDHKDRYPLVVADGKILSGYLSLTGVDETTHYQAYILAGH